PDFAPIVALIRDARARAVQVQKAGGSTFQISSFILHPFVAASSDFDRAVKKLRKDEGGRDGK
ncbi:MAG: hypothetical protein JJU11_18545, partial [Candidatus Sumerlaeia bacterium]|nr:hypothetical protein [Candidatus Sumerlaeia bacterium]